MKEHIDHEKTNINNKNLAIIVKFKNWEFPESIKTSFTRVKSQIYVLQMYSPTLTKRCNEAMKVRKYLKRNEPNIQAYAQFSAQLMIKREKDREYRLYAEC